MTGPAGPPPTGPWWRRIPLTRRGWIAAGVGTVVVVGAGVGVGLALTSGDSGHRSPLAQATTASPPTSPATSAATTTAAKGTKPKAPPPPKVNPLTGLAPSKHSVVAVKIDDTAPGRPQRGIDKADIVYIEAAEGGLTRLLAVYNTTLPVVEPVRSTRAGDEQIALQFGPTIVYVASGGSEGELAPLDKTDLRTAINDRGAAGFARDPNRPAPYNVSADLAAIAARLKGPTAKDIGLTWSPKPANVRSAAGRTVRTTVGATPVRFDWSVKMHRYVRVIGGVVQHAADGNPVATPNVVVQFCHVTYNRQDVDQAGNPARYTHTIGTGRVAVFRNGQRIDGTWTRTSVHDGTHLKDQRGRPIPLAKGGAWFVLVATGTRLG